jgi:hypothetical protein
MAKLEPITVRILVQVNDNEPNEIGAVNIPMSMSAVREGERLIVKAGPVDPKRALVKALRKSLKTAQRIS